MTGETNIDPVCIDQYRPGQYWFWRHQRFSQKYRKILSENLLIAWKSTYVNRMMVRILFSFIIVICPIFLISFQTKKCLVSLLEMAGKFKFQKMSLGIDHISTKIKTFLDPFSSLKQLFWASDNLPCPLTFFLGLWQPFWASDSLYETNIKWDIILFVFILLSSQGVCNLGSYLKHSCSFVPSGGQFLHYGYFFNFEVVF